MAINIYKHNSRSFFDVYNALVQAYPRKPTWLFQEMAGLFDFQSELMNRVATDILYPQTRESAYAFAALCDYDPVEADGATDTITFTLRTAMAKVLPVGYQVSGISPSTGKMVYYELMEEGDSSGTATITANAKQQRTYSDIPLFSITNSDDFKDYPVDGYTRIVRESFKIVIGSDIWVRVENFDNSTPTSKHFMIIYQSSGKIRIRFGDGRTGLKPTVNETVFGTFAVTQGLAGKVDAGILTINSGSDSDVQEVTNAGSSGGNDSETIASIIRNARGSVRLRDVVWSKEDLETAARSSSSSVQKALGIPGIGAASIHIIPSGGGTPSGGLITIVENYVQALTQFGALPITGVSPNYISVNATATYTTRDGFVEVTVGKLIEFGLTLVTSAFDNQIIEHYEDNGIESTRVNVINVIWAWNFSENENDALQYIIDRWISMLGDKEYRLWGQPLEIGDLWVMGNSLYEYGVDVFSLNSPTVNQVAASDEIISSGTVTVTPI
jgi:hypothetical protein